MTLRTPAQERSYEDFAHRCEILRERLADPGFLANKGLGNEVGFYLFCYDPALEMQVRGFVDRLMKESRSGALSCCIAEKNLYDVFLRICDRKRILEKIPQQEEKRGLDALTKMLRRSTGVEAFADAMELDEDEQGSNVVFITGVGEIYPLLRLHVLFEALQQRAVFERMPVVAFYPGYYNGQAMFLFSRLDGSNYYRAFDLI
ncbi:MAG: DUF1788 domain-containing protein [Slackia sp.]|nr:DUF1788 domain-containing protein [Slackia sp.]